MQVLDITTAKEPELWSWLAEQPCQKCDPETGNLKGYAKDIVAPCFDCEGTGLANPWASFECPHRDWHEADVGRDDCPCNGSGRVPKAVGLEELMVVLAGEGARYVVQIETNWNCPHEDEPDAHYESPCAQAIFTCDVVRAPETGYELFGKAEGPVWDTDLLMLAALRAVVKAGMQALTLQQSSC